jgi:hypothetical protein
LLRERITRNFGRSPQQDGLPLQWTTGLTMVKYNNEKRMHMYLYLTRVHGGSISATKIVTTHKEP